MLLSVERVVPIPKPAQLFNCNNLHEKPVKTVSLGGVQQLRGQNSDIFDPPPCVVSFYTISVDKNRHFVTPSPPHLVHVVIECPLSMYII